MIRLSLVSLIILILPVSVFAEDDEVFMVDFFCGWGGFYRPMEWTPVEIDVTSFLTEPFAGSIEISAQQDGLNTLNIVQNFVLTPEIRQHIPLVTKMVFAAEKCSLRICNERGRTQWSQDYSLWDFSTRNRLLTAVKENDFLIGVIGRKQFGILRLPEQSLSRTEQNMGKVYIGDKLPRMAPWDWTGYVPLDMLILYDPEWDTFNEHQSKAVAQWVSNGGKLMILLGSNPLPAANPIANLLPFEPKGIKQTAVPARILRQWGLNPDLQENVNAWSLVPGPGADSYETQINDSNENLFMTGKFGFGRVGLLTFSPTDLSNEQRTEFAKFWVYLIREILDDESLQNTAGRRARINLSRLNRNIEFATAEQKVAIDKSPGSANQYEVGWAHAASNAVMEYLYRGIRPLSIWWVILLLTTLAFLLGPVDYKVLKRFGRLPLTWLTCTIWIVVFTVGAYYGVQMLHGRKLEMKVVSVQDGIENFDGAWSTDYSGLFAPRNAEYKLEGLKGNQWWSGIAPTREHIWAQNREISGRRIYCVQQDGGNLPYSLPVNIWSIQCLLNESPLEKMPFTSEVEQDGEELVVRITNLSNTPISSGYALLNNYRGISFSSVGALASEEFRSRIRNIDYWSNSTGGRYQDYERRRDYTSTVFHNEDAFFAQGCLQRTQAMNAYLADGAAVVCVEYENAPVSFAVKGRSCSYDHIQLARLVVFPK